VVACERKTLLPPVQGAAKIQEPQAENPLEKRLEAAPPGHNQLHGIEACAGFLDPKEGLLMSLFEVPARQPQPQRVPGQARLELVPVPARQFLAGRLGPARLRE
jgi:hypothetical protein